MTLETLLHRSLSALGYPTATHELVNRYSESTRLDVDSTARISIGCLLRGNVDLGPYVRLSRGCVVGGDVTIGRRTNLEPDCDVVGHVEFGNYCAVARESTFQQTNHKTNQPSQQMKLYSEVLDSELPPTEDGPITVGNDVWIGAGTTVLTGVTIGDGAIVGAGSVVTGDVEPYSVVAGVPATRVKWRFPADVRERLLELEWWEWDEETIRDRRDFFERELDGLDSLEETLEIDRRPSVAPAPVAEDD
ncbi:acyltransferase [Natronobacterium gregoryi]|uniref:Acetyltransferase n=2 Tax=Natronobacterium gregoryi TaxID=44930 RepID=L0AF92_NATGS|nr:DapH/DapD/GlmU-related protein [Natronobacterium gregoryi]AFZ72583.1 acetyltransferase (isoleucine patch superfamily) [Natronobacterium gregoryi SP2]ELY71898.1 acetyltransferase (isoleucine patch superfamily)-like protein [Natronobacterium gregoryi SP2]PLK19336.1 acetyltransferase [Natronobacterium gregoryi SP2]SFJ52513.1 transferase hexapeptide (six repeat-containing protein) [Natronobacterium gregoryi]